MNVVCPGYVRTPTFERFAARNPQAAAVVARLHRMGRIAEPREVAGAVLRLCSDDASSFVTGHILMIDGGMSAQR